TFNLPKRYQRLVPLYKLARRSIHVHATRVSPHTYPCRHGTKHVAPSHTRLLYELGINDHLSANPSLRRNLGPRQNKFYRVGTTSLFSCRGLSRRLLR